MIWECVPTYAHTDSVRVIVDPAAVGPYQDTSPQRTDRARKRAPYSCVCAYAAILFTNHSCHTKYGCVPCGELTQHNILNRYITLQNIYATDDFRKLPHILQHSAARGQPPRRYILFPERRATRVVGVLGSFRRRTLWLASVLFLHFSLRLGPPRLCALVGVSHVCVVSLDSVSEPV